MSENITITNLSRRTASIDIEGIIGLRESTQFEQPDRRVSTYGKLSKVLEEIGELSSRRIVVNIRSVGGDVNDALLIHDALRSLDARITTRCYGYIASAATIIAQAASPGRREISANALYLIHNSVSNVEGNCETMDRTKEMLQQTDRRIAAIYAARSGRSEEQFVELMNCNGGNGRWLSPEQAIEAGLVDRVIKAERIAGSDRRIVLGLGLPEPPQVADPEPQMGGFWDRLLKAAGVHGSEKRRAEIGKSVSPLFDELLADSSRSTTSNYRLSTADYRLPPAKLAARPTETAPREDPSLAEEKPSANRSAYEQDALGLI